MPKHTTPLPLDLGKSLRAEREHAPEGRRAEIDALLAELPALQYYPLSAFGCADYIEEYAGMLDASGMFDSLKYGAAELSITPNKIDLAGLAAIGSALAQALAKATGAEPGAKGSGGKLRELVVDHCRRFRVQAKVEGAWLDLADAETIEAYLDFDHLLTVVAELSGGVLRPLWSRLRSPAAVKRSESPKPSTRDTPAS